MSVMYRSVLLLVPLAMTGCLGEDENLDPEAVARGEALAETCTACHVLNRDENRVGPTLLGVIGREAGSVEGYDYSPSLAESGLVWAPEQLAAYLQDPYGEVPGTKMAVGELSEAEAVDIVTYLRSLD